jgi:alkanesulfonate monooxygenase SsuD/methylene tetrahydromethanopterin reductase-like flavin-dependent oxidoreductase (luciferase family)
MRHGIVILPERRWSELADRWRRAEDLGFDHAWTFDHLMWRGFRNRTWFSAIPVLTAAAAVTRRIRLGTLVASPDHRHPIAFAKDLMALDDISGGRMICGIGAGGGGYDAAAFGAAPLTSKERATRFGEFVELTDCLLRQRETSFTGTAYQAQAVYMHPGCLQQPRIPFALAAGGRRGLSVVARWAQVWVTNGVPGAVGPARFEQTLSTLRDQVRRLEDACTAVGRDPATIDRLVLAGQQFGRVLASSRAFTDAEGAFADLGFTDMVVPWPRPEPPFTEKSGALDNIAPLLRGAAPREPTR